MNWSQKWPVGPLNWRKSADWRKNPMSESNHWGSHIPSLWMVHAGCLLLPAFTCLGHECQDLWSQCDAQTRPWFILSPIRVWGECSQNPLFGKKILSSGKIHRGGSNSWRCIKQASKLKTIPTKLFPAPVKCLTPKICFWCSTYNNSTKNSNDKIVNTLKFVVREDGMSNSPRKFLPSENFLFIPCFT